ncbi:MAG: hypothetical protein AUJ85_04570 [Elusimicrobia bacterium CG1_02_37_114]|nr:MAG: hypothetical protein AUJ85_04570 [Elusimicrobia bacterium CG1_02_37_114]PIV53506.1 MAG: 5,10-methylenetetrahydrofolate reductase [Elusimicrobia bacterium CG02_land_8_20_14_3_00_37_13]PIZ12993.1 MAG: 5,10-methylenetetrahydrofolate reductase [Elusimicrobia bacterium CG_4_10_14_0_8_um_filter_37_32]
MILSQQKPFEEILGMVNKDKRFFLISCNGCAEVCKTGGEEACLKLKDELEKNNKEVIGCTSVDFMCNKVLDWIKIISRHSEKISQADAIIALTCGVGVQAIASVTDKFVYPADNSIYVGGFQGLWPSLEKCAECGDCVLHSTGGICPITKCSKSLLNGSCGGAKNGKCEIDKELDCGWELIYNRLKKLNRLDNLKEIVKIRDYSKMFPSAEIRKNSYYDIEQ